MTFPPDLADDDIVSIGKLRRPGQPGAAVSYDPTHGIRIEGEDAPPEPVAAAAWIRRRKGWLRVYSAAKKTASVKVREFLKAWRKR